MDKDVIIVLQRCALWGRIGEYLMQFSTKGMVGKITARTVYYIHDMDIDPDGEREEIRGEAYEIKDGKIRRITSDGEVFSL